VAVHLAVTTAPNRHTYADAFVFVGLAFFSSQVTARLAKNLWGEMHVGLGPHKNIWGKLAVLYRLDVLSVT